MGNPCVPTSPVPGTHVGILEVLVIFEGVSFILSVLFVPIPIIRCEFFSFFDGESGDEVIQTKNTIMNTFCEFIIIHIIAVMSN
jgi:hypothetical protein